MLIPERMQSIRPRRFAPPSPRKTNRKTRGEGTRLSEPPDAARVVGEELAALVGAAILGEGARRGDPGRERRAERADRPVAAPDHAVPAEARDGMLDVRTDVLKRPCRRV